MTSTRPGRRPRRRLALAAAVVAAAAALTGCSADRLGAAAIVDGEPIATDELQELSREVREVVPGLDPSQVQVAVLQQLIVGRLFDRLGADLGVSVSDGEVAAELQTALAQTGGRDELVTALASGESPQVVPPSMLEQWQRDRLLYQEVAAELSSTAGEPDEAGFAAASQALSDAAREVDIEINPRYGEWDPQAGIAPQISGGLSSTVDELTARE